MLSRNRRLIRKFTIALFLLGAGAWIAPSYFSAERYRRRLETGLERILHRPVKFGALSFRLIPSPGFSIENVEVSEDPQFGTEPFARVDRIDCDLRWHSLWRKRLDFSRLYLDHPSFNFVLNTRGEWNVKKLLLQSGVTGSPAGMAGNPSSPAAEPLDLEASDARVNFQVGPNKKPFALTESKAALRVDPDQRRVQFQITASPVRSDLTIPTPGPVEVSGSWTPGSDLRGPIDARLRTRGSLLYDWIPLLSRKNPHLYGVVDADLHVTGSLPDLLVEGESRVAQLHRWEELPPSDPMPWNIRFRGRLVRGRDQVLVEGLDASVGDSHLHCSGAVENIGEVPQLDLVLSVERSRLEDALAVARRLWPSSSSWSLKGRVDAMLAIQGAWDERRYGGFVGAPSASLETPSGSYPLSDIAVRIANTGAILAPVEISLAPRVTLSAAGTLERAKTGPRYALQLTAKGVPLQDAVAFGRGLGVKYFQEIGATGSATASINLMGSAWPFTRPVLTAHADVRAARLLIPGLTEPLNLPRASLQVNGDEITADPVVAVLGTSLFNGKLIHQGARANPWKVVLRANSLRLEQGALWFDALGLRRAVPLLELLPGLSTFAARREAASHLFDSLNAQVQLDTPELSYHELKLSDFHGDFDLAGRTIRLTAAKFRAAGGRGQADGAIEFASGPPAVAVRASLAGASLQSLTSPLRGPVKEMRGTVNATGSFRSRGLVREELADNLTGQMNACVSDMSFGSYDLLGELVQAAHWGKLDSARGATGSAQASFTARIHNRTFSLSAATLDINGARLQFDGASSFAGLIKVNIRADLRHLRRHWLSREDVVAPSAAMEEVRLGGPIDHLAANPREAVASVEEAGGGRER